MCAKDHISALSCSFDGEQSGAIQVNLQVGSGQLDRTFYTEALTMQNRSEFSFMPLHNMLYGQNKSLRTSYKESL